MTDRYRASKPVARGSGRAHPREPEPAPPQPKAGVEALKSIGIFLAGGIGGVAFIVVCVYFAMLLSARVIDPQWAILAFTFASGGLAAVYVWLTPGASQ